jgi:hypothetical protein
VHKAAKAERNGTDRRRECGAGRSGATLHPPGYGIDFLDSNAAPVQSAGVVQAVFTEEQIERIAGMSSRARIRLLARARQEDLDSWYDSGAFSSMYTGAEESDEIREARQARAARKKPPVEDTDEIDALIRAMSGLSLAERDDDGDVTMSIPTVTVDKDEYDATGDVKMRDIDGTVDVEMHDVHGMMDVEMRDVDGYVAMEIGSVNADVDIRMSDIHGYVHLVLMDVDLAHPTGVEGGVDTSSSDAVMTPAPALGKVQITVSEVAGVLDVQIVHDSEPMDLSLGPVASDEHVSRRVDKRKRAESALQTGAETESPPGKRARLKGPQSATGGESPDLDLAALIESFQDLSVSFRSALDEDIHTIYPAQDLGDVVVESNPTLLATIISQKRWQGAAIGGALLAKLKALTGVAKTALTAFKSPTSVNGNALRKAMKAIAKELAGLHTVEVPKTDLSGSTAFLNNAHPTEGKKVTADPLSVNTQNRAAAGTGPQKNSRLMNAIRHVAAPLGENASYKMMHLLNHNVFGPGELWNLTPGPSKSNTDMERDIETPLKRAVLDKGLIIRFEAEVTYKHDPVPQPQGELNRNPDGYRFDRIEFTACEYELNHAGTAYNARSAMPDLDVAAIDGGRVNWNYGGLTVLREKPRILDPATTVQQLTDAGIPKAAATKIYNYNQDIAANKKTAPVLPSSGKKEALAQEIKDAYNDRRIMNTTWKGSDVLWA